MYGTTRRYHVRSQESFESGYLLQDYKKYLVKNDLMGAYDMYDSKETNEKIQKMLDKHEAKGALIIKDPIVERYAKDEDYEMVNEYSL
jgi:hypothetical protein